MIGISSKKSPAKKPVGNGPLEEPMPQAEVPGTRAPAVHSALSETGGPSNRGHGERGTSRAGRAALSERGSHRRHHTDGGGDSEHVFALCSLLGFQFAPRIPGLKHRGLYSFDKPSTYPTLEPLIGGRIGAASLISAENRALQRNQPKLYLLLSSLPNFCRLSPQLSPADQHSAGVFCPGKRPTRNQLPALRAPAWPHPAPPAGR
jgi:hypothetical protein